MNDDSFSAKEMLVQLMADVRSTRNEVSEQRLMLMEHIQASGARDTQIKEIKRDIEKVEVRLGMLEGFKVRVLAIWGAVWSVATLLAVFLLDKLWK